MEQWVKGTGGLVKNEPATSYVQSWCPVEFMLLAVQRTDGEEDGVSPSEPAWGGGVLLPPDCADQEQVLDSELWDLLKCVTLQGH